MRHRMESIGVETCIAMKPKELGPIETLRIKRSTLYKVGNHHQPPSMQIELEHIPTRRRVRDVSR